jgi:hypothetical protein
MVEKPKEIVLPEEYYKKEERMKIRNLWRAIIRKTIYQNFKCEYFSIYDVFKKIFPGRWVRELEVRWYKRIKTVLREMEKNGEIKFARKDPSRGVIPKKLYYLVNYPPPPEPKGVILTGEDIVKLGAEGVLKMLNEHFKQQEELRKQHLMKYKYSEF